MFGLKNVSLEASYRSEIASPLRSALAINPTCRPDSLSTAPFWLRSTIARADHERSAGADAPINAGDVRWASDVGHITVERCLRAAEN